MCPTLCNVRCITHTTICISESYFLQLYKTGCKLYKVGQIWTYMHGVIYIHVHGRMQLYKVRHICTGSDTVEQGRIPLQGQMCIVYSDWWNHTMWDLFVQQVIHHTGCTGWDTLIQGVVHFHQGNSWWDLIVQGTSVHWVIHLYNTQCCTRWDLFVRDHTLIQGGILVGFNVGIQLSQVGHISLYKEYNCTCTTSRQLYKVGHNCTMQYSIEQGWTCLYMEYKVWLDVKGETQLICARQDWILEWMMH